MCDTWGDPPWCRKAIEPARRRDAAHLFFQLVCRRYESKSILVTSNRSLSDWGMVFGDPTVATAILDRLLHHCTPVTIMGDSYRIREAKKKKKALACVEGLQDRYLHKQNRALLDLLQGLRPLRHPTAHITVLI